MKINDLKAEFTRARDEHRQHFGAAAKMAHKLVAAVQREWTGDSQVSLDREATADGAKGERLIDFGLAQPDGKFTLFVEATLFRKSDEDFEFQTTVAITVQRQPNAKTPTWLVAIGSTAFTLTEDEPYEATFVEHFNAAMYRRVRGHFSTEASPD